MNFNILSAVQNNTGYSLNAKFYRRDKILLDTGLDYFSISESISSLSEMLLSLHLNAENFLLLCDKLNIVPENLSSIFYFSKVHIQIFNSLGIQVREFSSYISEIHIEDSSYGNYRKLTFEAHPIPWFMNNSNNYRVYIDKTVESIIEDVFNDYEKITQIKFAPKFKLTTPKRNTKRINCIQNGESDWDFILRLLNEEDWDYTFYHTIGNHELIIYNDINLVNTIIEKTKYRNIILDIEDNSTSFNIPELNPLKEFISFKNDSITNLNFINSGTKSNVENFDSDYRHYGKVLAKKEEKNNKNNNLLVHNIKLGYSGTKKYKEKMAASHFVEHKNNALRKKINSNHKILTGITNSLKIQLGTLVTGKYNFHLLNIKKSILKEFYNFRVDKYVLTFEFNGENNFSHNSTIFMHPHTVEHSISHHYNRNYINGTLTGKVFGNNHQVYIDDMYFIKVQLPWQFDNYSDKSEYIFARYMTPWANKGYGFYATPRAGEEVVIAFENGDPDLPVVLGGLYNQKRYTPVKTNLKNHVLAIYDQPSENNKNNFLEMDSKTATVNLAAADSMRIRSFGTHLTQSKSDMTMKTSSNMLITSKEQMQLVSEKDMGINAHEDFEININKKFLINATEQIELASDQHFALNTKNRCEVISENDIILKSNNKITLQAGLSEIIIDTSGVITIKGTEIKLEGKSKKFNVD